MSATAAQIGKGTTLGYAAYPTPASYTLVTELIDLIPPKRTWAGAEATRYDSPSGIEEYIVGWGKSGEAEFEINYVTAECTALEALGGIMKTWEITLPDTHTVVFAGWISEDGLSVPNKKTMTQKLKISLTGPIVYT